MKEDWKQLKDCIDIEVSNTGFVRKKSTKKEIALELSQENNYRFKARLLSKSYTTRKIHVVVYELFSGKKIESNEWLRHKDGDKSNNNINNIVCEKRYNTNPNVKCSFCGVSFYVQERNIKKSKTGFFCCSYSCRAELLKTEYIGEKNPNFRKTKVDSDGYFVVNRSKGRMKLHKAIVCEAIGVDDLPKINELIHIHHRDCNKENNHLDNLSLLSVSDHKWLHKNFGNAGLWAFMNKKVSLSQLLSWSRDESRAKKLILLNAKNQCLQIKKLISNGYSIESAILKTVLNK